MSGMPPIRPRPELYLLRAPPSCRPSPPSQRPSLLKPIPAWATSTPRASPSGTRKDPPTPTPPPRPSPPSTLRLSPGGSLRGRPPPPLLTPVREELEALSYSLPRMRTTYCGTPELRRRQSTPRRASSLKLRQGLRTVTRGATLSPAWQGARRQLWAAKKWAGNLPVGGGGSRGRQPAGHPNTLLTPDAERRRPTIVRSLSAPVEYSSDNTFTTCSVVGAPVSHPGSRPDVCPGESSTSTSSSATPWARNSLRFTGCLARRAGREVRWSATSGLGALLECGSGAKTVVRRASIRVAQMADQKFKNLQRSISSWSLSTIKKPKIHTPKLNFKTPKLKLFSKKKKNRVDPKDTDAEDGEVQVDLLKKDSINKERIEDETKGLIKVRTVIHDPSFDKTDIQPKIVLTVHDHSASPERTQSPSPGLLNPNEDIEYIDSDADDETETESPASVIYSDHWYDAAGTLTRSRDNLNKIDDDYENYANSRFYDAGEKSALSQNYEDVEVLNGKGSHKGRDWVQSLDDETEKRIQQMIERKARDSSSLGKKSKSEIRLDDPDGAWAHRDEIILHNTPDSGRYKGFLQQEFNANVDISDEEDDPALLARKESIKKIFQVRGKLSLKQILDTQSPKYQDTDIYIASTPVALASRSGTLKNQKLIHKDSIDGVEDDGILGATTESCQTSDYQLKSKDLSAEEHKDHNKQDYKKINEKVTEDNSNIVNNGYKEELITHIEDSNSKYNEVQTSSIISSNDNFKEEVVKDNVMSSVMDKISNVLKRSSREGTPEKYNIFKRFSREGTPEKQLSNKPEIVSESTPEKAIETQNTFNETGNKEITNTTSEIENEEKSNYMNKQEEVKIQSSSGSNEKPVSIIESVELSAPEIFSSEDCAGADAEKSNLTPEMETYLSKRAEANPKLDENSQTTISDISNDMINSTEDHSNKMEKEAIHISDENNEKKSRNIIKCINRSNSDIVNGRFEITKVEEKEEQGEKNTDDVIKVIISNNDTDETLSDQKEEIEKEAPKSILVSKSSDLPSQRKESRLMFELDTKLPLTPDTPPPSPTSELSEKAKSENKKKKILQGISLPKSIKSFAGSMFYQQSGSDTPEGDDSKKKKGKISTFIKNSFATESDNNKTKNKPIEKIKKIVKQSTVERLEKVTSTLKETVAKVDEDDESQCKAKDLSSESNDKLNDKDITISNSSEYNCKVDDSSIVNETEVNLTSEDMLNTIAEPENIIESNKVPDDIKTEISKQLEAEESKLSKLDSSSLTNTIQVSPGLINDSQSESELVSTVLSEDSNQKINLKESKIKSPMISDTKLNSLPIKECSVPIESLESETPLSQVNYVEPITSVNNVAIIEPTKSVDSKVPIDIPVPRPRSLVLSDLETVTNVVRHPNEVFSVSPDKEKDTIKKIEETLNIDSTQIKDISIESSYMPNVNDQKIIVISKSNSSEVNSVTPDSITSTIPLSSPQVYNAVTSKDKERAQVIKMPEEDQPPKPAPRTKKGRYGYSSGYGQTKPNHPTSAPVEDANYYKAGIYDLDYTTNEHIYDEISEKRSANGTVPRPSPRVKKGRRTPSVPHLAQPAPTTPSKPPSTISIPKEIIIAQNPDWIQQRGPIPSPRTKKGRSTMSLNTIYNESIISPIKKNFEQCPINDSMASLPTVSMASPEMFYSGKAASISYGFSTGVPTIPVKAPPSPPMRHKKASLISLPSAMAEEERFNRLQINRSSLRETSTNEKPSFRRIPSRRRTISTEEQQQIIRTTVKSEAQLGDVVYSVHSLMGREGNGTWLVTDQMTGGIDGEDGGVAKDASVSLAQVLELLQEAYGVTPEVLSRLSGEANNRKPPDVNLHVSLKEARDLRPRTAKGTCNPYCSVNIPSTGDTHRTRLEKDTLNPRWNQDFVLRITNLQKDVVKFELVHEHTDIDAKQVTAVKNLKGLKNLIQTTTAQVQQRTTHQLGSVIVPLKDIGEGGVEGWYALHKDGDLTKMRGELHLNARVASTAQLGEHGGHSSYAALLTRLIHNHLATATNNNQDERNWSSPWQGQLSEVAAAILAQHAIVLDLNDADRQLSWWVVGSKVPLPSIDAKWTLSQLRKVQTALARGDYEGDSLDELRGSFVHFLKSSKDRFRNLHKEFLPSSGVLSEHQLTFTLKALQSLECHSETRKLLDFENIPEISDAVNQAITAHCKSWWKVLLEEKLRGVRTADEQINRVIPITTECFTFLTSAHKPYNAIFMKEMNIPYFKDCYLYITNQIKPCVRPLLMNIYNRMPALKDTDEHDPEEENQKEYALSVGTSLWQLYRNLGRLHKLGEQLPFEARQESGVREYHRWFSKGVMRWLEVAVHRANTMIRKAVELDNFTPIDEFCNYSSSITDTIAIFHDVKNWWAKLDWPDAENSGMLLSKILDDICSCSTNYSDLLKDKVDSMFHRQGSSQLSISQEICVGLNNIEKVRRELENLPELFGLEIVLETIRMKTGKDDASNQLEATVHRIIQSSTENMEGKIQEFMELVLEKMTPTLDRAVTMACESGVEKPLLEDFLDRDIKLLHENLEPCNFERFLFRLWEITLNLFHKIINRNTEKRKSAFFAGVHSILEKTYEFFTPEGVGLEPETAKIPSYVNLVELLENLRMSSEALICKYYDERQEEQSLHTMTQKAQCVVKMYFTRQGRLTTEVIMAKDMVIDGDSGSIGSQIGLHAAHSAQVVDSYVKVQLVPAEWFPNCDIRKTRTQRKSDPAVYEETFHFDLNPSDDGCKKGMILFTLKDHNLGRSNTFIGEVVVPLSSVAHVDSSETHLIKHEYLKMTTPGLDIGYKSLSALHFRTSEKVAVSFLKKVSKRLPEARKGTSLKPDDERSRERSPKILDRLKL